MRQIILLFTAITLLASNAFCQEDLFSNLQYPELQVTPRATERLAQLAELEKQNGPLVEWTILTSSAITLVSAARLRGVYRDDAPSDALKKDTDLVANAGIVIGAGWAAWATYVGSMRWTQTRLNEIKKIPAKDKRGELTRERMAEESLEYASETMSTVEGMSIWSNFLANIIIANYAKNENKFYGLIAATTSFLPGLFPNVYTQANQKHKEYKRKIYAPIAGITLNPQAEPQLTMVWQF